MKQLLFALLIITSLSFFSEAGGIPLVRDDKVHHYKVKMTTKVTHKKEKKVISASSFFGKLTPKQAAMLEQFEDDKRRSEYIKKQKYITESTTWFTYENENLGFSVDYPDILSQKMKKPADTEGIWLESHDGEIKLTVLGSHNINEENAKDFLHRIAKMKDVAVLKKEHRYNWYRFIYCDSYHTIYRYGIVEDGIEAGFILGYPNEKREEFKPVTERMEQTLNLGD